ncbi:MAG: hypothetical protein HRT35_14275 [Algicola sp.]|nr:hypothetical protein [Algicola sp.]
MTEAQLESTLADILKHSHCIDMLDAIITTAMHSKYLHNQKLEQLRPKEMDANLAIFGLIRKLDQDELALSAKRQELEQWIMRAELAHNFIDPKFYEDAEQIQEWIDGMDIPANVIDIGVSHNTTKEGLFAEGTLRREVSRKALRTFFGKERVLNIYLALYNEKRGTNPDKVKQHY